MRKDLSYGVVPLRFRKGQWQVFLVQLHAGHWGFPKGHPEVGELPLKAATRELLEETGLHIKKVLFTNTPEENYFFYFQGEQISKKVIYFIAEVEGSATLQAEEVAAGKWVDLDQAQDVVTYAATQKVCEQTLQLIAKLI